MKTSNEIRKEIEILEAEAAGLRLKIAEQERDIKACEKRLDSLTGGFRGNNLISDAKRRLESTLLAEADAKLPTVRVVGRIGTERRTFLKKTEKSILLRVATGIERKDRFGLDGYPASSYKGEYIHPEDLAKILDGTI